MHTYGLLIVFPILVACFDSIWRRDPVGPGGAFILLCLINVLAMFFFLVLLAIATFVIPEQGAFDVVHFMELIYDTLVLRWYFKETR